MENKNVVWHENGSMTYSPKRTVFYVPELSVGDPKKDIITVPNVPVLVSVNNSIIKYIKKHFSLRSFPCLLRRYFRIQLKKFFVKVRLKLYLSTVRRTKEYSLLPNSLITSKKI